MKHLMEELEKLRNRGLFLILDYDGTLTEIAPSPDEAVLKKETRQTLRRLLKKHKVAIMSGRSLRDVKRLVGIKEIYYGGNHGLEISGPNFKFTHPDALRLKPVVKKIYREARKSVKKTRGVILEFKGLSVSFHYRMVSRNQLRQFRSELKGVLRQWTQKGYVAVVSGKKVVEVRPNVDWDKGMAASLLLKKVDPKNKLLPVGMGDDRTDEDLFSSLSERGLTVIVSRPKRTRARYYLRNPEEVRKFLKKLT